ncbi:hypothetical protein, partial [Acinetobacter baumannii]|uniref:hypothetical protein n=1 Tax=Acinetobacter baumannii TaxID=470 RepID=UPI001BC888F8
NDTGDYSSRMYDSGDGLGNKIVDKSGFKILSTPLLASDKNKYNLDTVAFGSLVLTGYSHKVIISTRTDLLGKSPYTQDGDGVTNVLGNAVVTWERGVTEKYGVQTITNLWDTMIWRRVMRNGVWQNWVQVADDNSVVHKTGNETIAGDKTFTGKIGFSGAVANPVVSRTVSGTNGMSFKFRRSGNAVHVEISGNYTGTNWTGSSSPSYAAELFNVVVPAGFAPDDWSQSAIIEYGSAVGFGRYGYDSSSRKMTFTYRGMVGGVGSSKWIVSSTTYTTSDALP